MTVERHPSTHLPGRPSHPRLARSAPPSTHTERGRTLGNEDAWRSGRNACPHAPLWSVQSQRALLSQLQCGRQYRRWGVDTRCRSVVQRQEKVGQAKRAHPPPPLGKVQTYHDHPIPHRRAIRMPACAPVPIHRLVMPGVQDAGSTRGEGWSERTAGGILIVGMWEVWAHDHGMIRWAMGVWRGQRNTCKGASPNPVTRSPQTSQCRCRPARL